MKLFEERKVGEILSMSVSRVKAIIKEPFKVCDNGNGLFFVCGQLRGPVSRKIQSMSDIKDAMVMELDDEEGNGTVSILCNAAELNVIGEL